MSRTPLAPVYAPLAGGWTRLADWEYPAAFSDPVGEHHAVRHAAGAFDFSFMSHVGVRGPDALAFVQRLITNDAARLERGRLLYSPLCDDTGGMVDDCTVIRREDDWLVTAGLESTAGWVRSQADGFAVELDDCSARLAVVAVQGPTSAAALARLGVQGVIDLAFHAARTASDLLVARVGYTGELGFEVFAPLPQAAALWTRLLELIPPCGALALDTLRIEAGLPLTGVDFDRGVSPYELGLGRFVRLDKGDFIGRGALVARAHETRGLVGLRLAGAGVPARGAAVRDATGRAVGAVSSACLAPTVGAVIALAVVARQARPPLEVDGAVAELVRCPVYDPGRRRARAGAVA